MSLETSLEIRPIIIADHYQVMNDLMRKLHDHEYLLFKKTASWDDIEVSYMRHVMAMQEECDGTCLVAYVNGIPAGFMFGYLEEQDDSRIEVYEDAQLYVSDGYVDDQYRRQGIYRKLNEELEKVYIAKGVKRIVRFTRVNNDRMKQFLEGKGYEVTRLLYEKWL
jgi:ribosomal protein S18 acetylase RimI-like enzyme